MRVWKVRIFYIFLSLILVGIVTESIWTKPGFRLDEKARGKLAELPGQIETEFVGSKKYWHYSIVKGELLLRSVKEFPPAHLEIRPYINFAEEVPDGLPKIEGLKYHGPYRLSPDKSVMLLSLSTTNGYVPKDFTLIQMEAKQILFERRTNHRIEEMAWSPDSNMFVVLNKSSRTYFGVLGILSFMFGHPVMVCKYYLSIYDRRGNLLINTEVASGLLGGGGQVSWDDKSDKRGKD